MSKTYGGLRKSALIEIGLYIGGALLVDRVCFDGTRYWNVSPHPFWPIVLLASAQYGTSEGLVAALAATAALLAGKLPQQTLSQDLYEYIFSISKNPLMWFTAAVVWGELRSRHATETKALREELSSAKTLATEAGTACKQMAQVKEKLEVRVAGQLKTAIRMYEAARGIDKLEPARVLSGVLQLVRVVMNPEKFSLFLLKNGRLELAVEEGWNAGDHYASEFTSQGAIYQEVIGRQRGLCSANREEELILGHEGMLAAPLLNSESGKIIGMLKIEKLGFLDLNLSSVQTFKVLCEWIANAYSNALLYESALSEKIFDEKTSLFSYGFFDRQIAFLSNLARRVGFDISMVLLRLDNPGDLTDEERGQLPGLVGAVVRSSLRHTDLAFEHHQEAAEHFIVLPNTSVESSQIVADKLLSQLQESLSPEQRKAQFSTSIQAIYRHAGPPVQIDLHLRTDAGLLPGSLFEWHLDYLSLLTRRIGFQISIVEIEAKEVGWRHIAKAIGTFAAVHLRQEDLAFEPPDDSSFRILLPNTSIEEAKLIEALLQEKTTEELRRSNIETALMTAVYTVAPGASATRELPKPVLYA